jgi:hypothetical protein
MARLEREKPRHSVCYPQDFLEKPWDSKHYAGVFTGSDLRKLFPEKSLHSVCYACLVRFNPRDSKHYARVFPGLRSGT